jgi:hypothetical protein
LRESHRYSGFMRDSPVAKLIFSNEIFDELSLGSLYEAEVEEALKQRAPKIFPGFHYINFKCLVSNDYDVRRADFALVEENYRSWWVCELESATHSLEGHVLPQVRTFVTGRYGASAVECMMQARSDLDRPRLQRLVRTEQPQVLVIVNRYSELWARAIGNEGAYLGVFEIFRSDLGQFVFRVNGFIPTPDAEHLSVCEFDANIPRLLRICSPGSVGFTSGEKYRITVEGAIGEWRAIVTSDSVWLSPLGGTQLPKAVRFSLTRDAFLNLYLAAMTRHGGKDEISNRL